MITLDDLKEIVRAKDLRKGIKLELEEIIDQIEQEFYRFGFCTMQVRVVPRFHVDPPLKRKKRKPKK